MTNLADGLPPLDDLLKEHRTTEPKTAKEKFNELFEIPTTAPPKPKVVKEDMTLEEAKAVYERVMAEPKEYSQHIALVTLHQSASHVLHVINPKARPFDAFIEHYFFEGWEPDFKNAVVPAVYAIDREYPKIEIAFLVSQDANAIGKLANKYLSDIVHKRVIRVSQYDEMAKNIIDRSCEFRHY